MTAWNELKQCVLSTEQVRQVDRIAIDEFAMHSLVLMENAALNCVHWIARKFSVPQRTLIYCGRGNNGGDGLVIARHLQLMEWPTTVVLQGPEEKLSADNAANYAVLKRSAPESLLLVGSDGSGSDGSGSDGSGSNGVSIESQGEIADRILSADLIIDSMLGTGATGEPRSPFREWINAANATSAFRLAIDIPTGVNAESGEVASVHFEADQTLTFVARKPAMVVPDAASKFGELEVLPIGIPAALVRRVLESAE